MEGWKERKTVRRENKEKRIKGRKKERKKERKKKGRKDVDALISNNNK